MYIILFENDLTFDEDKHIAQKNQRLQKSEVMCGNEICREIRTKNDHKRLASERYLNFLLRRSGKIF